MLIPYVDMSNHGPGLSSRLLCNGLGSVQFCQRWEMFLLLDNLMYAFFWADNLCCGLRKVLSNSKICLTNPAYTLLLKMIAIAPAIFKHILLYSANAERCFVCVRTLHVLMSTNGCEVFVLWRIKLHRHLSSLGVSSLHRVHSSYISSWRGIM